MKLLVSVLLSFLLASSSEAKSVCSILPEYLDGTYYNISILGVAAVKNDADVIDVLIEGGCDVNYAGAATWYYDDDVGPVSGATPLHIASTEGSLEVVIKLLTVPGINQSINAQDDYGVTPVYDAASWGYYEIVSILAAAGADIEIPGYDGATPVHVAAIYGNTDTVKTLAELGANLDVLCGPDGNTPLIVAVYYGYFNISILGVAAVKNDADVIGVIIDSGCDVNYAGAAKLYYDDDFGLVGNTTPLHIASTEGSVEVVVKLLTVPGINQSINAQDDSGCTPVYDAASWGYYDIVSILAAAGADIDIPEYDGVTPVHVAAAFGYTDTVKTLAELGANLDVLGGPDGYTPLMIAVYYGYKEVVQYLVDQGVDLNIRDNYEKTAFFWAKWANYGDIANILEENGAKL